MKTDLEKNNFSKYWSNYISLIEKIAFSELNFHKIFTYAFDLRPHLYAILEKNGFTEEARLEEHCLFDDNYIDVVYHSKINRKISYRKSNEEDLLLYFNWANDSSVRENSYQTKRIDFEDHQKWYLNKIKDPNCLMLIFENHLGFPIGQGVQACVGDPGVHPIFPEKESQINSSEGARHSYIQYNLSTIKRSHAFTVKNVNQGGLGFTTNSIPVTSSISLIAKFWVLKNNATKCTYVIFPHFTKQNSYKELADGNIISTINLSCFICDFNGMNMRLNYSGVFSCNY